MKTILVPLLTTLVDLPRSRASLHLEMLALRQQLAMVANRENKRHRFHPRERIFGEIVHFNATYHPTAEWTAQQLVEAFPFDTAPRYVMRDRDSIYGKQFRTRVKSLGIEEVVSAPRSPWQNPYVERIIGSIRRECLLASRRGFRKSDRKPRTVRSRVVRFSARWRDLL